MLPGRGVRRPVIILAIAMSFLLSGCAGSSQSDLAKAKAAGASEEAAKQKQKSLEDEQARLAAEVKKLQAEAARSTSASPSPSVARAEPAPRANASAGTSCGANLSVGAKTTCAFAANVEREYYAAGGGTNTVVVYSPVTGQNYVMSCVAGVPSVCRGGNNAVVYIR